MNAEKEYSMVIKDIITQNKRYLGNEDLLDAFCEETVKRTKSIISLLKDEEKIMNYILRVSNSAIIKVLKDSGRLGSYRVHKPSSFSSAITDAFRTEGKDVRGQSFSSQVVDDVLLDQPIDENFVSENIPAVNIQPVEENIVPDPLSFEHQQVVVDEKPDIQDEVVQQNIVDEKPDIQDEVVQQNIVDEVDEFDQLVDNSEVVEKNEFVENNLGVEEKYAFNNDIQNSSSSNILEELASSLHVLNSQNPTKQYYMIYKLRYIEHMKNKDIAKNMNISETEVTSRLLELSDELKKCFNH